MCDLKGLAVNSLEKVFSYIVLDVASFIYVYLHLPQAYFASGFIYKKSATLQGDNERLPTKANTVVSC